MRAQTAAEPRGAPRAADPSFEDLANPAAAVDEALSGLFGDRRDHAVVSTPFSSQS